MVNGRKTELLFIFLILSTLSLSVASFPLTLTNLAYGKPDGDHDTDGDVSKDKSSDDSKDKSSDDSKDKSSDDSKDKSSDDSKDKRSQNSEFSAQSQVFEEDHDSDEGEYQESDHGKPSEDTQKQGFEDEEDKNEYDNHNYIHNPLKKDHDTIEKKIESSNEEQEDSFLRSLLDPLGQSPESENTLSDKGSEESQVTPPSKLPNCQPEDSTCSPPIPGDKEVICNDAIDNDGDQLVDFNDPDCPAPPPPGPATPAGPAFTGGGGGRHNNDNGNRDTSNEDKEGFISRAIAQVIEHKNEGDVYYILIENADNGTNFVPDKVTLTTGFTVVWINNDESKDHSLSVTTEAGDTLLNALVHPNNFIKYEFQSEGTYFYSDSKISKSGIITILPEVDLNKISKPLRGIEQIISSIGIK